MTSTTTVLHGSFAIEFRRVGAAVRDFDLLRWRTASRRPGSGNQHFDRIAHQRCNR
jgi:hypothetical protein